jgi:hypothetical protein
MLLAFKVVRPAKQLTGLERPTIKKMKTGDAGAIQRILLPEAQESIH